jgi:hypothetical protein
VVTGHLDQPKRDALRSCGLSVASEWWVSSWPRKSLLARQQREGELRDFGGDREGSTARHSSRRYLMGAQVPLVMALDVGIPVHCTREEILHGISFRVWVPGQVPHGTPVLFRLRRGIVTYGTK